MHTIILGKQYSKMKDFVNAIIQVRHGTKELCTAKCVTQYLANNNWHIKLGNNLILEFVEDNLGFGSWKIV